MKTGRYRVKTPTMAIFSSQEQRVTVTVPAEVILAISAEPPDGDRLIDVVWNDKRCLMFAQDLRERCEPLD